MGIKGSVIALHNATGQQVWAAHLKGGDFVNVVLHDGRIIATCCGKAFCLDALTGEALWHNPLKGYGRGLATLVTESSLGFGNPPILAEKLRRDQEEAGSASSTGAAACA